jgi:hypothetical protein
MERTSGAGPVDDNDGYAVMLRLEDLESLLEEVEEAEEGGSAAARLPDGLRERMEEMGVHSPDEIRREVSRLHRLLDEQQ